MIDVATMVLSSNLRFVTRRRMEPDAHHAAAIGLLILLAHIRIKKGCRRVDYHVVWPLHLGVAYC
ncbi:hypothetical protein BDV18DRAFT_134989 [Aspergillus unguis]